jgi:hypothetical protein
MPVIFEERYSLHDISIDEINAIARDVLTGLQTESPLRQEVRDAGIDVDRVATLRPEEVVSVRYEAHGIDPVTSAIIIAFTPVAAEVARDLWRYFILPRIRQAKGFSAIKPEE